jgi:hypothetical protein
MPIATRSPGEIPEALEVGTLVRRLGGVEPFRLEHVLVVIEDRGGSVKRHGVEALVLGIV